jgi:hypothetical protein
VSWRCTGYNQAFGHSGKTSIGGEELQWFDDGCPTHEEARCASTLAMIYNWGLLRPQPFTTRGDMSGVVLFGIHHDAGGRVESSDIF